MNERPQDGSVLLIGGNLICGTIHGRKLLNGVPVSGLLQGCSPFSLACTQPRSWAGETTEARRVDLTNGLEDFLRSHPAQMLAVDLHYVCQPLVRCGDSYFTKFADMNLRAYGEGGEPVALKDLTRDQKKKLIRDFADTLLKYFPGENIALLQTVKTEFYAVKNRVRAQENTKLNQFVGECETWFREFTGCTVIDTLKFYYMEKKSAGFQYEKEAYLDLADNVKRFVRRQHVRRRPVFRYSLDRYCRYYDNLYKRAFGAFLRTNNAVENLVYSSEPWFVKENYELLRAAEKLLKSGYRDVADGLDMTMKNADVVREILLAMDAAIRKDYVNPGVRYDLLFRNRICVRALWQEVQKYAQNHFPGIFPEQITEVNYGYYFSLMQLELTDNKTVRERALEVIKFLQADRSVELTPYAIDLWGSCVSRLNFQYDNVAHDCTMVFRGNMFQALPLFLDAPKVQYNPLLFAPPITADNKVVQYQLDGSLREKLNKTGTDWVVIDLYTLTALSLFRYQDKVYCDNQNFCSKKLGAGKVTLHKEFTQEQILAELDKFADYITGRYGDRVILIKHKRMEHYIDFNDKILPFTDKEIGDSRERNPYNDRYTDYFAKRSGCYYIDIIDQFLSDEMNLLYLNSVHYENEFYRQVCKIMGYILRERPNQRHFTTYDSLTRVKRIARLNRANPGSNVVRALFRGGWLDDALLKLDGDFLEENAPMIARIYDEGFANPDEARRRFSGQGSESVLETILAASGKS